MQAFRISSPYSCSGDLLKKSIKIKPRFDVQNFSVNKKTPGVNAFSSFVVCAEYKRQPDRHAPLATITNHRAHGAGYPDLSITFAQGVQLQNGVFETQIRPDTSL